MFSEYEENKCVKVLICKDEGFFLVIFSILREEVDGFISKL